MADLAGRRGHHIAMVPYHRAGDRAGPRQILLSRARQSRGRIASPSNRRTFELASGASPALFRANETPPNLTGFWTIRRGGTAYKITTRSACLILPIGVLDPS